MKQGEYQYIVDMICLKRGLEVHGCFRTSEQAEAFKDRKIQDGYQWHGTSGRIGVMPYHEWSNSFDVERYMNAITEWAGDYKFSGRD